ncbi:uncharacterized protein LOC102613425 isoform X2 [Citrus sinensis]|uniref:uncharacterized protein LOC102613425 isoform X2 n=1 Tax=Citrus sinensis TaxID=2711 RepID=UPI0003D756D2|nr:uncharacterized protein LOC102613425 isoform X2 [Citrus sinensis]
MGVKMEELLNLKASRKWRSAGNAIRFLTKRRRSFRRTADLDAEANNPKLPEQGRASSVVVEAVLHFTESLGEDVPSSEYIGPEAGIEARRFHEPVDDVESTVNGHDVNLTVPASLILENCSCIKICELLGRYEKRALAMFYLVLEAASFLLDIFGKSKRSILLAAFLLSAFGFAITMSMPTCIMRRIRAAAARMHIQKLLRVVLEISFSVVQLIVTLIYFILAELGVKNSFNASVFPLVFAIVAAVFTFKYDGEVTDLPGLDNPAADNQFASF